jgi:hypothetical protein
MKIRIKSESEFVNKFGQDWRNVIRYHWSSTAMDYLFNKLMDITIREIEEYKKDVSFYINVNTYKISADMLDFSIIYNDLGQSISVEPKKEDMYKPTWLPKETYPGYQSIKKEYPNLMPPDYKFTEEDFKRLTVTLPAPKKADLVLSNTLFKKIDIKLSYDK